MLITDDLRIRQLKELSTPEQVIREFPRHRDGDRHRRAPLDP